MLNALIRWLNSLLGRTPPPPPRQSTPGLRGPSAADLGAMRVEYHGQAARRASAAPSRTSMRYARERLRLPSLRVNRWARATPRQKILVVLAGVSFVAMLVAGAARFSVSKVLPAAVHGVYATDDSLYATRRFELRAHRVVFTTSDTIRARTGLPIRAVHQSEDPRGIRYDVEYQDEGGTQQLSFAFTDGPTPEIRFVHQPRIVWRRVSTGQTLMRQIY